MNTIQKRFASTIIYLILLVTLCTQGMAVPAAEAPFSSKLTGSFDGAVQSGGQDTLIVSWQITANKNGLRLVNVQSFNFCFDNTVLQLTQYSSGNPINDGVLGTYGTNFPHIGGAGYPGAYNYNMRLFAAKSIDGDIGYVQFEMGDPYESCACPPGIAVTLESVRFAFRPGKSAANLKPDSIRMLNANELKMLNQTQGVLLATDEGGNSQYFYNKQSGGNFTESNSLETPTLTYPGSATAKHPQNAPGAPTLAGKTATSITLNAIGNAEYRLGVGGAWQDEAVFNGLVPNTGYTFYARLKEDASRLASPASEASAVFKTDKATLIGTVLINGTPKYGETFTVDTTRIDSSPKVNLGNLYYKWYVGAVYAGIDDNTYIIKESDIGESISITVTAESCIGSVSSGSSAIVTKADGPAAPASVTGSYTDNGTIFTYKINEIAGAEYSKDGILWQDSPSFGGFTTSSPATVFYARIKETATRYAGSIASTGKVVFVRRGGETGGGGGGGGSGGGGGGGGGDIILQPSPTLMPTPKPTSTIKPKPTSKLPRSPKPTFSIEELDNPLGAAERYEMTWPIIEKCDMSDWAPPEIENAAKSLLIPDSLISDGMNYTKPITRAEFAGIAVKIYERLTGKNIRIAKMNPFIDTNDEDVLKAYNAGIMIGYTNTIFEPDIYLNREQCATVLVRVYKKVRMSGWTFAYDAEYPLEFDWPAPFADDTLISDWAKESVYFMASHELIKGMGGNLFAPRNTTDAEEAAGYATATREQAIAIAIRMVVKFE